MAMILEDFELRQQKRRGRITELFTELGRLYEGEGLAGYEIHSSDFVHAFYHPARDSEKLIHLLGYPNISSEDFAMVFARLMDYKKVMEMRSKGIPAGSEHAATIKMFVGFGYTCHVEYDAQKLRKKLAESCELLA